jgi:molybdopterin molybdotransferase
MLELEEAQRLLFDRVHPMAEETVPLPAACGRFLAKPLIAPINLPPFDNSAMDGFAVRAEDTAGASKEKPVTLHLLGRTAAGEQTGPALQPQSCLRVFTGSALPPESSAVIMQEDTQIDPLKPASIHMLDAVKPWENVRLRGEDVKEGEQVLCAGERLNAQKLALISALGVAQLLVSKRPVVGLIATGNELVESGGALFPGQVFESNRICLASMLEAAGACPVVYPIVADELDATRRALKKAFDECDVVVSTGGVSVGELDYVKRAFEEIGGKLHFWKVAMKPGKPFVFGECHDKFFFGLPGNPVSAFVTFLLLVRPVVLKLQGALEVLPPRMPGTLVEPLANTGERRHFMRVCVDPNGKVSSAGPQASHRLGSLAQANALIDLAPNTVVPAGTSVSVLYAG